MTTMNQDGTSSGGASGRPLISIVLATNRDSPYLRTTLQSVLEQTMQDWELLIVDNGVPHPERVAQLIEGDHRMSAITIESSATAGVARNVGVSHTTADLITFLDDDDVWAPERLERHLRAHSRQPTAPATYSGYWHIDGRGRRFGEDWRSRHADSAAMLSGRTDTPLGPTLVIRRSDFVAIGGFSSEIPILVDFELALRLALRGDLVYLDSLLVGYRRHADNMTSTAPENALLRRGAMEDMIDRQRWAAAGRGDAKAAELFRERLERFRRNEAHLAGTALIRFLKRRDLAHARKELAWGLSRAPTTFLLAIATAPLVKATSMLGRE